MENQTDVILYQTNNLPQAINVRVENDTVWLNRQQIATLFDRDVKTIGKHINNALAQELMGFPTVANFATVQIEGNRNVMRDIEYYNLDVILSVGYRVNSPNGIAFRIWANSILRTYLLNGYVVNQRFEHLERRVLEHDKQIETLVMQALPPQQGVFFDGQIFDAYAFVSDLIKSAKKSIILIDNYVDESVLLLLSKRKKNVAAKILTANFNETLKQDLSKHNAQYPPINIEKFTKSHDRFLIIDDTEIFHIGASLKDLGKKWFAFSKMNQSPLQ
ncbi:MAG: virulence RhuM family protein [Bacteroidales bacterium]|nr:virulence RhuM family protein [Bacteroidales bacterium]